jgi:hypothetical protein
MKREKDITILFDTNEELLKEVIRNQKEILYYLKNKLPKEYGGDRDVVEEILTYYQAHAIHGQKWYITTAFEEDLEKIRIDYGRPEIWMVTDAVFPTNMSVIDYFVKEYKFKDLNAPGHPVHKKLVVFAA